MNQNNDCFKDKWEKNPKLVFNETLSQDSDIFNWILQRNGFLNVNEFVDFLKNKRRILDAGCGNGRVSALLREYSPEKTQIIGVDIVSSEIARKNLENYNNVFFYEKNLLEDLSDLGKFDFIYCQEVLHHTLNPAKAFSNLCNQLSPYGEIAIYVYKEKAPVREFVDDFIRNKISELSYEDSIKICEQITILGKILSESNLKIKIPSIDVLEIEEGEYDIQRFIYYFFMKCFWNSNLSFDSNVVINYDWYKPQICSRHTLEEVRSWFVKENIKIIHECVDHYGITIRGIKL